MSEQEMMRVKWVPQAWPHLHPVQDVLAAKEEVRSGFTSRAQKVSERGEDIEQIDDEQAKDNTRADNLDLSYDSDGRRAPSDPGKVRPEDDASDDGKNKD